MLQRAGAAFLLAAVNCAIAWKLFALEYSAYLDSIEGLFMAIARGIAEHPRDLLWWPIFDLGIPFQNAYLPLLQVLVAAMSRASGWSIAHSYHIVCAALFAAGPVAVFLLADQVTRKTGRAFSAALLYSLVSPSAFLVPAIARDLGSAWNLRRLQTVVRYGEGPLTATLAIFPIAVWLLYRFIQQPSWRRGAAAGIAMAATVLFNAFGATLLMMAAASLLVTVETARFRRNAMLVAIVGALAYVWISPLLPPSVISAIRENSPTVEGDYRFNIRSAEGVAIIAAGFGALWWLTRKRISEFLRFAILLAWLTGGVTLLGSMFAMYVLPQPHRYQTAMDMALCVVAAYAVGTALEKGPRPVLAGIAVLAAAAALIQARHDVRYARSLIQSVDIGTARPFRLAQWFDRNLPGARAMIAAPDTYFYSVFSDNPQVHGGPDPMLPNPLIRTFVFQHYTGMNAGSREGEIAALWLKALGAQAATVPDPGTPGYPFANPRKFDGVLPVLAREPGVTIYSVPLRSRSLAHIVDASAIVKDPPIHGLDIAQIERYVAALGDGELRWTSRRSANIRVEGAAPGRVVSVQVTYQPGWHATVNGAPQAIRPDGLGMIVIEPGCVGLCEIQLEYDGGRELIAMLIASVAVMIVTLGGILL